VNWTTGRAPVAKSCRSPTRSRTCVARRRGGLGAGTLRRQLLAARRSRPKVQRWTARSWFDSRRASRASSPRAGTGQALGGHPRRAGPGQPVSHWDCSEVRPDGSPKGRRRRPRGGDHTSLPRESRGQGDSRRPAAGQRPGTGAGAPVLAGGSSRAAVRAPPRRHRPDLGMGNTGGGSARSTLTHSPTCGRSSCADAGGITSRQVEDHVPALDVVGLELEGGRASTPRQADRRHEEGRVRRGVRAALIAPVAELVEAVTALVHPDRRPQQIQGNRVG